MQEQGRYALSLTRWFGGQDLSHHETGDAIYFPTLFTPLIAYPARWAVLLVFIALLIGAVAEWIGRKRRARGIAIGLPLALLVALDWEAATRAPGVSYLVAWPLLGAMFAAILLMTAPKQVGVGWRVAAMALCAAPAFLLIVPLLPSMVVALGLRGAAPIIAVAGVVMLFCILPQSVFLARRGESYK